MIHTGVEVGLDLEHRLEVIITVQERRQGLPYVVDEDLERKVGRRIVVEIALNGDLPLNARNRGKESLEDEVALV